MENETGRGQNKKGNDQIKVRGKVLRNVFKRRRKVGC